MPSVLTCIIHQVYRAIANGLRRLDIDATTTTVANRLELRMPEERSLEGISAASMPLGLAEREAIARRLGFVGIVEYHTHPVVRVVGENTASVPTIEQDLLLVMRMHSDAMPPATISHCRQLSPMNSDIKSSADMSDCDGTRPGNVLSHGRGSGVAYRCSDFGRSSRW